MRVLTVLWGLLVDDGRLASILCLSLLVAFGAVRIHHPTIAALVIWIGLVVSIWVSVEHQLQRKLRK